MTIALRRQKLLLALLEQCPAPLGKTKLVKLAFLLSKETALAADEAYYDFVPYKYGPFSFALYRELRALGEKGLVQETDDCVLLCAEKTGDRDQAVASLSSELLGEVDRIVREYGRLEKLDLIRVVYERYPWYASRSEIAEFAQAPRPETVCVEPKIYTVGYQGRSIDSFMNHLLKNGMDGIVDVRANPASRKYGYSRKTLQDVAGRMGMDYVHVPDLGIPGHLRADLESFESYVKLFDRYETEILPRHGSKVNHVGAMAKERPRALLCMERDPNWCHRSRLALRLEEHTQLPVCHL